MKISIGRYLNGNSLIHKLDARIKLLANIAFIILIFLADTFLLQAFILLPLIVSFVITTKKPLKLFSMMILPIWITFFLFLINCFILETNNIGDAPVTLENWKEVNWVKLGNTFRINYPIFITTMNVFVRIYSIILAMTILTLSTPPVLLTKALDFYFTPLKWIKIPTHILVMVISIALRFVPTLVDEAQRILKAQASRGVDFKNGNFKTKIKATIVLIVPLFVSTFSKAEDLANTMETRGYDPYGKRTSYRKWTFNWFDGVALFSIVALIVIFSLIISGNVFNMPWWWEITKNFF